MEQEAIDAVFDGPVARQLLDEMEMARMSYRALDGGPRVIPVGFVWRGGRFVVCTVPNSAKLRALRADPRVALTLDTNRHPPKALLVRGVAELDHVEGVPDDYIDSNRKRPTPSERAAWETEVRRLFDEMVRIVITPTWVKAFDFSREWPAAVAEIARRKDAAA